MPVHGSNKIDSTAVDVWRRADAVCFDVDSTLIREEAIDKLADYCGVGAQVAEWTKKAMGGSVTFREALQARLSMIKPTRQQLQDFAESKDIEDVLTPRVAMLISMLQDRGVTIYLVSGGFRWFIEYFADYLSIPKSNIYANRLLFNEEGDYIGFDETEPTSRSGGKTKVVAQLKLKHKTVVMIGDGATDMEASPPADTFIGFGGNVARENVKNNAPWFIYNFQDLIDELDQASVPQKKKHQQQHQEQEQAEEMFPTAAGTTTYQVSDADSLSTSPMHVEEIGVKAS